MPNNRLKKIPVTSYLPEEDINVVKFFAAEMGVSVSKLIEDALYYLIKSNGDTLDYPEGGFSYADSCHT